MSIRTVPFDTLLKLSKTFLKPTKGPYRVFLSLAVTQTSQFSHPTQPTPLQTSSKFPHKCKLNATKDSPVPPCQNGTSAVLPPKTLFNFNFAALKNTQKLFTKRQCVCVCVLQRQGISRFSLFYFHSIYHSFYQTKIPSF